MAALSARGLVNLYHSARRRSHASSRHRPAVACNRSVLTRSLSQDSNPCPVLRRNELVLHPRNCVIGTIREKAPNVIEGYDRADRIVSFEDDIGKLDHLGALLARPGSIYILSNNLDP